MVSLKSIVYGTGTAVAGVITHISQYSQNSNPNVKDYLGMLAIDAIAMVSLYVGCRVADWSLDRVGEFSGRVKDNRSSSERWLDNRTDSRTGRK
ncbi:MAG: hypothetical protein ABIH37_04515 [archaeon]